MRMRALSEISLSYLGKIWPSLVWWTYGRQARRLGLQGLYLILSFDCDTPDDTKAVEEVDEWLFRNGIKRTYAVPGKQLLEGAEVYNSLARRGADFINHGAMPHTEWRENRYWSINFYDQMTHEEVMNDIRSGSEMVRRVTGLLPSGFRVPHFGLFQKPDQVGAIHATLRELGYRFSTSTLPYFAFFHGPAWKAGGVWEIPLSGSFPSFFTLLDSWGYVKDPYHPVVGDDYAGRFLQTVERLMRLGISGVLNYYVDPAHVCKSESFFKVLNHVLASGVTTLSYGELLDLIENAEVS